MKSFLSRYYHLIALAATALFTVVSAIFLVLQSLSFKESLNHSLPSRHATTPEAFIPSTNAISALEMLKNKVFWKINANGSYPFVSRPYLLKDGKLIDPSISSIAPLFPPVPNKWIIEHNLAIDDLNILSSDPGNKGFTVLEEFLAGTNPNNPDELPDLCTKLNYSDIDIKKVTYMLEFLGEEESNGHMEYQLRPGQPIPNPAKGDRLDNSVRNVVKGGLVPGIPFLKVIDYVDKKKTINDTEFDFGELILENTITGERFALTKKNVSREYKKCPIEFVENVNLHYQLIGSPQEDILVERGKEFILNSLDKKQEHSQKYRVVNFSSEGILLENESRNGKPFTIKPSVQEIQSPATPAVIAPNPDH
jgi:hypothetical protein